MAVRLAKEKIAGVAISDVNEAGLHENAELAAAEGVTVSTHILDVSKLADVRRLADEVIAQHGRVTHLVNNAGVVVMGTFEHLSIEDFEWLMSINFWGVIYGWIFFADGPPPVGWLGISIISGSGLFVLWREHRLAAIARKTPI